MAATIGVIAAAGIVQAALGHLLAIRGAIPSVVAIAVVLFAIRANLQQAIVVGAVAGLVDDVLGGTGGAWLVATTLLAVAAWGVTRFAFSDGIVQRATYVALGVVLRDALFWIVERLQHFPGGMMQAHLRAAAVQAVLTGVVAALYLVYRLHFVREHTMVQQRR